MHHLLVVIILFSMGLSVSAFFHYSFDKTRISSFCVVIFHVSISLTFKAFLVFSFFVLNSILSQKNLITFFNFVLNLFKRSVRIQEWYYKKTYFQRGLFLKKNSIYKENSGSASKLKLV